MTTSDEPPRPDTPNTLAPNRFRSLSPAVWRASTVVFDNAAAFAARKHQLYDGYTYGITGTPTTRELENRVAELEGATHCVALPSGQAALCLSLMALLRAGDHVLVSDAAYGPLKHFTQHWLQGLGVAVDIYPPAVDAGIVDHLRPNTRMICLESPGTLTMEVPDVPAIVAAARERGIHTLMDNTWATPLGFRPLDHGVDLSVEAASKMFGGHSDLLLGTVSTRERALYERLREAQSTLGQAVSPDDCFLLMRGLETLSLRFAAQARGALTVAEWLRRQPAVARVLYPPLPDDPGHALWRRDFTGAGCVLSLMLGLPSQRAHDAFFDALHVFSIGASWGGVHSLAAFYPADEQRRRVYPGADGALIRLSVGLEPPDELIADLARALRAARQAAIEPA